MKPYVTQWKFCSYFTLTRVVLFPAWKQQFWNIRFWKSMLLFLKQWGCNVLSKRFLMKNIISKHEANDFAFFVQRVSLFSLFNWRKTKQQVAERRNFLDRKLIFKCIVFIKPTMTNYIRPSKNPWKILAKILFSICMTIPLIDISTTKLNLNLKKLVIVSSRVSF